MSTMAKLEPNFSGEKTTATLKQLLLIKELNLKLVTENAPTDGRIRWFSISELPDPAPFLESGDILLTMCLTLPLEDAAVEAYVRSIAERGIIGIGVSIGPSVLSEVPKRLLRFAEEYQIPVFEVPVTTKFIGITRAIADIVTKDTQLSEQKVFEAQRQMIRSFSTGKGENLKFLITELQKLLPGDSWAALIDQIGEVQVSSRKISDEQLAIIEKSIDKVRHHQLHTAATEVDGDSAISLFPIGAKNRVSHYLVLRYTGEIPAAIRSVIAAASTLISLVIERSESRLITNRTLRQQMVRLLTLKELRAAEIIFQNLYYDEPAKFTLNQQVVVIVASNHSSSVDERIPDVERLAHFDTQYLAVLDNRLTAIVPINQADQALDDLRALGFVIGVSEPVPLSDAAVGLASATSALRLAESSTQGIVRFDQPPLMSPLSLLPQHTAQEWSSSVLSPLLKLSNQQEAKDLFHTLKTFLQHNGKFLPTAEKLNIHRQTLRGRIASIEEIMSCSLEDPMVRSNLWLALQNFSR